MVWEPRLDPGHRLGRLGRGISWWALQLGRCNFFLLLLFDLVIKLVSRTVIVVASPVRIFLDLPTG